MLICLPLFMFAPPMGVICVLEKFPELFALYDGSDPEPPLPKVSGRNEAKRHVHTTVKMNPTANPVPTPAAPIITD